MHGGANGARVRLDPQRSWEVDDPAELARVLKTLEGIQQDFNFFANLMDLSTKCTKSPQSGGFCEGIDRTTGKLKWTATPVDLVFGSNSELRAAAKVYPANDARGKLVRDFVAPWSKLMNADRFTP
jgi:catalase (peroxidase I)